MLHFSCGFKQNYIYVCYIKLCGILKVQNVLLSLCTPYERLAVCVLLTNALLSVYSLRTPCCLCTPYERLAKSVYSFSLSFVFDIPVHTSLDKYCTPVILP
jgi:hypothetical protein